MSPSLHLRMERKTVSETFSVFRISDYEKSPETH
jgi:hypothetical protein